MCTLRSQGGIDWTYNAHLWFCPKYLAKMYRYRPPSTPKQFSIAWDYMRNIHQDNPAPITHLPWRLYGTLERNIIIGYLGTRHILLRNAYILYPLTSSFRQVYYQKTKTLIAVRKTRQTATSELLEMGFLWRMLTRAYD